MNTSRDKVEYHDILEFLNEKFINSMIVVKLETVTRPDGDTIHIRCNTRIYDYKQDKWNEYYMGAVITPNLMNRQFLEMTYKRMMESYVKISTQIHGCRDHIEALLRIMRHTDCEREVIEKNIRKAIYLLNKKQLDRAHKDIVEWRLMNIDGNQSR